MALTTLNGPLRTMFTEALTIATLNTIPVLTYTPRNVESILLVVGNATFTGKGTTPAFTLSGKTLTWNNASPDTGFDLNVGERVFANYITGEIA